MEVYSASNSSHSYLSLEVGQPCTAAAPQAQPAAVCSSLHSETAALHVTAAMDADAAKKERKKKKKSKKKSNQSSVAFCIVGGDGAVKEVIRKDKKRKGETDKKKEKEKKRRKDADDTTPAATVPAAAPPAPAAPAPKTKTADNPTGATRLFMGNLPWSITDDQLAEACGCELKAIKRITDKESGKFYGSVFVEASDAAAAGAAVKRSG